MTDDDPGTASPRADPSRRPEWTSELRRTWAMLGPATAADRVETFIVGHTLDGSALRLHVDDRGSRHLFIPAGDTSVTSEVRADSLTALLRRIVFDASEQSVLDICCPRPQLFDVFDELLASVLGVATVAPNVIEATTDIVRQWRDLLRGRAANGLSFERELGLYAELWTLSLVGGDAPIDIDWWRGPLCEPKDIVCPAGWIEVKGVGPASTAVTVNGLDQLSDLDGVVGYMAVVEVIEDPSGNALSALVESVRSRSVGAGNILDERLLLASWDPASATGRNWSVAAFHLIDAAACPHLTPQTLSGPVPAGVHTIRYDIDLSVLQAAGVRDPMSTVRSVNRSTA